MNSRFYPIDGIRIVSVTDIPNSLADDMKRKVKLHIREEQTNQDVNIVDYIGAGLEAAENYLQKDIFPRSYVLDWWGGQQLILNYGRVSDLAAMVGDPPVDVISQMSVRGSNQFKDAGLSLFRYGPGAPAFDYLTATSITFKTGFTDVDTLPRGIIAFVNAFVGMLNELREVANVGTIKYSVDEIPTYLLQALKNEVIA